MNTLTETCGSLSGTSVKRGFAAFATVVFSVALAVTEVPGKDGGCTAAGHPAEGKLESFLGEPKLDIQQVHKGGRFPNILVAVDGTVLALWGGVKVRRSEDGGQTWTDWQIVDILPDGPQNTNYGCMGGLVRLPIQDKDILIYSNYDSPEDRRLGTVWSQLRRRKNLAFEATGPRRQFCLFLAHRGTAGNEEPRLDLSAFRKRRVKSGTIQSRLVAERREDGRRKTADVAFPVTAQPIGRCRRMNPKYLFDKHGR